MGIKNQLSKIKQLQKEKAEESVETKPTILAQVADTSASKPTKKKQKEMDANTTTSTLKKAKEVKKQKIEEQKQQVEQQRIYSLEEQKRSIEGLRQFSSLFMNEANMNNIAELVAKKMRSEEPKKKKKKKKGKVMGEGVAQKDEPINKTPKRTFQKPPSDYHKSMLNNMYNRNNASNY